MSRLYITEDGHVEDSYLVIPFDPATQKIQQLREMIKRHLNRDDNFTIFDMGVKCLIVSDETIAGVILASKDLAFKFLLILDGINQKPPRQLSFVEGHEPEQLRPVQATFQPREIPKSSLTMRAHRPSFAELSRTQVDILNPLTDKYIKVPCLITPPDLKKLASREGIEFQGVEFFDERTSTWYRNLMGGKAMDDHRSLFVIYPDDQARFYISTGKVEVKEQMLVKRICFLQAFV